MPVVKTVDGGKVVVGEVIDDSKEKEWLMVSFEAAAAAVVVVDR